MPRRDPRDRQQHFRTVAAIVNEFRAMPQVLERSMNLDEPAGLEKLSEHRVDRYCHTEHHQPEWNRRPVRSRIGSGDHPGVEATREHEVDVHEIMERRMHRHRPVQRREIERRHSPEVESQRNEWVGNHPQGRATENGAVVHYLRAATSRPCDAAIIRLGRSRTRAASLQFKPTRRRKSWNRGSERSASYSGATSSQTMALACSW